MNISAELEYLDLMCHSNHYNDGNNAFLAKNLGEDNNNLDTQTNFVEEGHQNEDQGESDQTDEQASSTGIDKSSGKSYKKIFAVKRLVKESIKVKPFFKINKRVPGSIERDTPNRILSIRCENEDIHCEVEWQSNKYGVVPTSSFVTNTILKQIRPDILCDYYESIIEEFL